MAPEVADRLAHLNATVDQGIALKRDIIENLRPSSLSNLGLVPALEIQAREFAHRADLEVSSRLEPVEVTDSGQITIYRLVQESLTNVAKYAEASRVEVELHAEGRRAHVCVRDNGRGFDPRTPVSGGHGLKGMQFRVEAEGGAMQVESAPGRGTVIRAWLPIRETAPAR